MALGYLIGTCQHPGEGYQEDRAKAFTGVHSRRMRHNSHQMKQGRLQLDIRMFYTTITVNDLNRLWSTQPWRFSGLE